MRSRPILSRPTAAARGHELPSIEGQLPPLSDLPAGCRFHPRCDFAEARCGTGNPLPDW